MSEHRPSSGSEPATQEAGVHDAGRTVRWRRHPEAAFVDFRDRITALPLAVEPMSNPYAMQATAAAAWRALGSETQEFETIVDRLAESYSAPAEMIRGDLARLFAELEARHLVERVGREG